jgi:hypothetical protein
MLYATVNKITAERGTHYISMFYFYMHYYYFTVKNTYYIGYFVWIFLC